MLDYARERALEALQHARTVVLATTGPAGIQASEFACEGIDLTLYLLVPQTSDHLFNLEQDDRVALVTHAWELHGKAHPLLPKEQLPELHRLCLAETPWTVLVRVEPIQLQILRSDGWGSIETIDLDTIE